jgi:pimeloyl-ACP methyl ester carboxylesterase
MDLPCSDGSARLTTYADVVLDAMAAVPDDDIVLVGHSLGAVVVPLVAARRPARAMVSLCGVIPKLGGRPWDDGPRMDVPGTMDALITSEDGAVIWSDQQAATNAFYYDCEPEIAAWAFQRLRPQNSASLWEDPYPLTEWPKAEWKVIACCDDRVVTRAWSRHMARSRIGTDLIELPGGHSPFAARPRELADTSLSLI